MFGNDKQNKKETLVPGGANQIFAGTVITGEISSNNDIRIDGTVIGTLNCKGKVVLGANGRVEGNVNCLTADISGTIHGNINVTELLNLKNTANLLGDMVTNKLAIEPGANFTGSCSMGALVKEIHQTDKQGERKLKEKTA